MPFFNKFNPDATFLFILSSKSLFFTSLRITGEATGVGQVYLQENHD